MSQIVIDATTAERLRNAEMGTEVVGPDGQPVAAVLSPQLIQDVRRLIEERKRLVDEAFSPERLAAIKAAEARGGAIPHDEVMKRLGLE
jgi:hypothetical protein